MILDRHWINPDIQWHQQNTDGTFTTLTRQDFWDGIDHWKNIFNDYGLGPNSVLGVGLNLCDIRYVTAILACLELGAKLVIIDKPGTAIGVDNVRCRIYAPFDLMIINPEDCAEDLQAIADTYAKQVIDCDIWFGDNYCAKDPTGKDIFAATDDSDVIACTSSGTTGTPKPISYHHDFFYELCERNQRIFNWQKDDRVLHLSNFHHGGASANFFWPTLKYVNNHYFDYGVTPNRLDNIINLVSSEHITSAMFPNQYVLDEFIERSVPYKTALSLHVLGSNRTRWIPSMKKNNITEVYAHWGFNEQEGPILLNKITANDNSTFDTFNFSKPLDDFYSLKLIDQGLEVFNCFRGSYVAKDLLTLDNNGDYIFHGRMHGIRVRDTIVDWNVLNDLTRNLFDYDQAYIIPDSEYHELYLLVDKSLENHPELPGKIDIINSELQKINDEIVIKYISYEPMINFYTDTTKFSYLSAKLHFRKKFNLN